MAEETRIPTPLEIIRPSTFIDDNQGTDNDLVDEMSSVFTNIKELGYPFLRLNQGSGDGCQTICGGPVCFHMPYEGTFLKGTHCSDNIFDLQTCGRMHLSCGIDHVLNCRTNNGMSIWNGTVDQYFAENKDFGSTLYTQCNLIPVYIDQTPTRSAGMITLPTFTACGPSATIGPAQAYFHTQVNGCGLMCTATLCGLSYTFTNDQINYYVVGNYNNGNPVMEVITDVNLIHQTTYIPIYTLSLLDNKLHYLAWDTLGLALPNKICDRLVRT